GWMVRMLAMGAVLALGMAAGSLRDSQTQMPTGRGTVAALATSTAELTILGTVLDDPRPRADRQQVVLVRVEADGRPALGRILAWLPRGVEVASGDRLS